MATLVNTVKLKNDIPQKMWWLSLYVLEWFNDNDKECINYSDLYQIMSKIDSDLEDESRKDHYDTIKTWEVNGKHSGEEKPAKSTYYFVWMSAPESFARRNKRKTAFFSRLAQDKSFKDLLNRSEQAIAK